ncbi:MAG TPA: serine hydrolase [Kofleriaceae bacterium]|nr:serine hydrolase [Kofleriaceae bacterium]
MWKTLALALVACTAAQRPVATGGSFGASTPEAEGLDTRALLDLATWVRDQPVPIYSLLISRHGKVVFELYTGQVDREAAHYLMSATKSVLSILIGIAIDQHLIAGPDVAVADALPADAFPTPGDRERFRKVTLADVMAMSALDTPDPPRVHTPEAVDRQRAFLAAPDRVRFALGQPIVAEPGATFLYNDEGPVIASGILEHAAGEPALRFAEQHLFGPLGFAHYEWMHADPSGHAMGGYGLRLRPIDMQKLGVLFLDHGAWNGAQLVPRAWVDRSFTPWIKTSPAVRAPNYGWFWWADRYGPHWEAHLAHGWKGQRIVVIPEQGIVVTMTAYVEDGTESALIARIIEDFVEPAVVHGARPDPAVAAELARVLAALPASPLRGPPHPEPRMIPSIAHKGR